MELNGDKDLVRKRGSVLSPWKKKWVWHVDCLIYACKFAWFLNCYQNRLSSNAVPECRGGRGDLKGGKDEEDSFVCHGRSLFLHV